MYEQSQFENWEQSNHKMDLLNELLVGFSYRICRLCEKIVYVQNLNW